MFIVSNRIPVNPEHNDAFEERFRNRDSEVDEMDGFIAFQLLRPNNEGDPYIVMTMWKTQAHFEAWKNSDTFKNGHGKSSQLPEGTFLGRPVLETYDVVQSTLELATE